jgi:flagellar L-ring protein precursor FlgH
MTARASMLLLALVALGGCSHLSDLKDQANGIAKGPQLTPPGASKHPVPSASNQRIALAQTPVRPASTEPNDGSLWRDGPTSLFGDRRARTQGDIVTVVIEIDDRAELQNQTSRTKSASEGLEVPNFFGITQLANKILPDGASLDTAVDASSNSNTSGQGQIRRQDKITLQVAATVVQVLPNGHLVIAGSQEIRVNQELRDLQVGGIIRPEDVSRRNTITYEKIADARILYGGRGTLSNVQDARYGQRIFNVLSPF